MERMLRFACAGALALATATVCAQNSPPAAPAPGRDVPTSPEAAPAAPPNRAGTVPAPAGNAPVDTARIDADHQAARARCEVHSKAEQEACLREADEAYERELSSDRDASIVGEGAKDAGIR